MMIIYFILCFSLQDEAFKMFVTPECSGYRNSISFSADLSTYPDYLSAYFSSNYSHNSFSFSDTYDRSIRFNIKYLSIYYKDSSTVSKTSYAKIPFSLFFAKYLPHPVLVKINTSGEVIWNIIHNTLDDRGWFLVKPSIGYGKIQNKGEIEKAYWILKRLQEDSMLIRKWNSDDIVKVAEFLTKVNSCSLKYEKFDKYFYKDFTALLTDMELIENLSTFSFLRIKEINLIYRRYWSSISYNYMIQPAYRLDGANISIGPVIDYRNRPTIFNFQWDSLPIDISAEFHKPVSFSTQVDLTISTRLSPPYGSSNELFIAGDFRYIWNEWDEFNSGCLIEIDEDKVQGLFLKYYHYIEDHIILDLSFDLSRAYDEQDQRFRQYINTNARITFRL